MERRELDHETAKALDLVLGYLNFSSGAPDASFLANLNRLFRAAADHHAPETPRYSWIGQQLSGRLAELKQSSSAFADAIQAETVLRLLFQEFPPAYREFHRDLLATVEDCYKRY